MPFRERGERVQMMMAPEELAAIENFRFKHRIPSARLRCGRFWGVDLPLRARLKATGQNRVTLGY